MHSTSSPDDYRAILRAVRAWPAGQRFNLVREVLETLHPTAPPETQQSQVDPPFPKTDTLSQAKALLADLTQPPPTDEQVRRWLEEERMKKYGGAA